MTIDVQDAVRALYIPPVELVERIAYRTEDMAAYVPSLHRIVYDVGVLTEVLGDEPVSHISDGWMGRARESLRSRGLDTIEKVIAHELFHAKQREVLGGADQLMVAYTTQYWLNALGPHEANPFEAEADAWARDNHHLVKIS